MADNQKTDGAPQVEPTFVVDVSADHVWRGTVHSQFYTFLWVAVAFMVGTLFLSWSPGDAPIGTLQAIVGIFAIRAVWSSIAAIRGFNLNRCLGAVMMLELIAIVAVFLHFQAVRENEDYLKDQALVQIDERAKTVRATVTSAAQAEALNAELEAEWNMVNDAYDWGLLDIAKGPIAIWLEDKGTSERARLDRAWSAFGTGWHVTWITSIAMFVFFAASLGGAVAASKKDDGGGSGSGRDGSASRRRNRDGARKDADKKADGDKKDEKAGWASKDDASAAS